MLSPERGLQGRLANILELELNRITRKHSYLGVYSVENLPQMMSQMMGTFFSLPSAHFSHRFSLYCIREQFRVKL